MFKILTLLLIISIPFLTGCVAAVATGAIVGSDMASDRRTTGIYIEDGSIELKTSTAIAEDSQLKASTSISVVSYNRVVLLVGQAPNESLRSHAADVVRETENIRRVHNEIRIAAPNSFLSGSSDSWITTKAKSLMLAEKDFASTNIKVITENGEIFLMGLVTKAEADKAIAIVRKIDGVERVVQIFEYIQ
ncbi:MAG: divisome-associated lipoprotein YraP [Gammaproteobacteria bacterium]|nr:divisome-associated lipoprotein YraP [Gammaproteobacteria bacterium]